MTGRHHNSKIWQRCEDDKLEVKCNAKQEMVGRRKADVLHETEKLALLAICSKAFSGKTKRPLHCNGLFNQKMVSV